MHSDQSATGDFGTTASAQPVSQRGAKPARSPRHKPFKLWEKLSRIALLLALIAPLTLLLAAASPWRPYLVDVLAELAWLGWLPCLPVVALGLLLRSRLVTITALCLCCAQLLTNNIAMRAIAAPTNIAGEYLTLKVGFANLGPPLTNPAQTLAWLLDQDPDIIGVAEAAPNIFQAAPELAARYPYRIEPAARLGWPRYIFSKHPFVQTGLRIADEEIHFQNFVALRSAVIAIDQHTHVTFSVVHLLSPRNEASWLDSQHRANTFSATIQNWQNHTELPFILAGDFNATPLSSKAKMVAEKSDLHMNTLSPFDGTWPDHLPTWASIPIDHVWASKGLGIRNRHVSPPTSGDHRAIVVEVLVPINP